MVGPLGVHHAAKRRLFIHSYIFAQRLADVLDGASLRQDAATRIRRRPHVWITALMFFQTVLLIGYVYAHLLQRLRSPLLQGAIHLAFALLTITSLPPAVGTIDMASINANPLLGVLMMLTKGIGLPLVVLSATAPLIQHWFSLSAHERADDPYFLYAASNLGSFGALLAFPLLLEPSLPMTSQTTLWSVLFGIAVILVISCSYLVRLRAPAPRQNPRPYHRKRRRRCSGFGGLPWRLYPPVC